MPNYKKITATLLGLLGLSVLCSLPAQAQVPADPYNYGRTSSFTYYGAADGALNGLLKTETVEPDNAQLCVTTTYTYDAYGNKTGATTANCAGATGRAVFASRSSGSTFAAVASQTISVNGTNTTVAIPAGMFATSATNALSQSETRTYDPRFGAALSLTGPNGLTTNWQFDDFGRKTKEIRADGTNTVVLYCVLASSGLDTSANSSGCPTPASGEAPAEAVMFVHSEPRSGAGVQIGPFVRAYTDSLGREIRTVTQSFDGAGQPTANRGVLVAKDTVYNAYGAKALETQPYFLTSGSSTTTGTSDRGISRTDYDVLGRVVAVYVVDPAGSQSNVAFGAYGSKTAAVQTISYSGLSTTTANDKGQTKTEEKNILGEVIRITNAASATIAYQRDAFGNLVKTKDALQNVVSVSYDIRGRKVGLTDPDTGWWEYDYDALGQLVWQRSPNQRALSQQTTLAYDKLGRMIQRVEPEYTSTWSYDKYADGSACTKGIGKLCESGTSNGVTKKVVYDSLGRPINTRATVANGPSWATAVVYDANSRVVNQIYPTGLDVGFTYTALGFNEHLKLRTPATVNPLPATPGGTAGASVNLPAGTVLWQARVVNAWGKAEQQLYGNYIFGRATFEAATGRTTALTAGQSSATNVVNQQYVWDSLNNLSGRTDQIGDGNTGAVTETFAYEDKLNRLTGYTVAAPAIPSLSRTVSLQYNALGMLLSKSDVGVYSYGAQGAGSVRPHALQSVTPVGGGAATNYTFDANGNLTGASGGKYRTVAYTSFNLPDSQAGIGGPTGGPQYTWQYDENHQRIKETKASAGGQSRTTWYLHPDNVGGLSFESEMAGAGNPNHRHYLMAGGQVVGVLVANMALPTLGATQTAPPTIASITFNKVEYWHKDHLGSLIATTDHNAVVTARYAYDPFGKRRLTNGNYDASGNLVVDWTTNTNNGTDRGYTGHEHLDDVGLVHMNGRIFDATLGMFLQGDPLIQDPSNLQNYNRYGYCFNNPLTCTDPSGYGFLGDMLSFFKEAAVDSWHQAWRNETLRMAAAIGAGILIGPGSGSMFSNGLFGGMVTGVGQAAVAGFVSGAIASGNLQGGLQGAFTAALFYGAGSLADAQFQAAAQMAEHAADPTAALSGANSIWGSGGFARAALHGVVGCVSGTAGGGKCGAGALSASFSELAHPLKPSHPVAGVITSAVIGGTASQLGGGKFSNGAMTGAFAYIFNHWAHNLELAAYGREAHKLLQDYMEERGYVTESKCVNLVNCVDGRFDIGSARTLEVWEIKRNSFPGLAMGELALDAYTKDTGLKRGGDLKGLKVMDTITLQKGYIEYQYTNYGGGLIGYSRFDNTPHKPVVITIPKIIPLPGGSGRGRDDRYGY